MTTDDVAPFAVEAFGPAAFEAFPDAITISEAVRDERGRAVDMVLRYMNERARAGQPDPDAAIGARCSELWPQMLANGSFAACLEVLDGGGTRSGEFLWTEAETYAPAGYDYRAVRLGQDHLLWVLRDNTSVLERLDRLERSLVHQQLHDPLTGIANRALVDDRLGRAIARLEWDPGLVAVLFIDIDLFKVVNDGLGHEAGDALLREVPDRLRRVMRAEDDLGRIGADEFVLICQDLENESEALAIAERVREAFATPFVWRGTTVTLTASIGVAVATTPEITAASMLRDADVAMYRAKQRGRDQVAVFDEALRTRAVHRLETEAALRRAIDGDELFLEYQPIVELETGRVRGVEALARWRHPEQGRVPPAHFIPIAEETGLILPLGRWVLERACSQLAEWQHGRAGRRAPADLTMSVNVSGRQLADARFVDDLVDVVRRTDVDPSCLSVEVTETVLMEDVEQAAATLASLQALGVRVSIDDFGTGYSSLSYLGRLPIDCLKIDGSFVAGLDRSPGAATLCNAIASLARSLGLHTIAEGVETTHQRDRLVGIGCDDAQGFLFARPLPADEVGRHLRDAG